MGPSWWMVGSIILNSILVILFITGGIFMTKAYLRKMKKD